MISPLFTILPILSSWENCALNLIGEHHPKSVFFVCKSAQFCPNNHFYKIMNKPSQTLFEIKPQEFPTFKDTDMVFVSLHDEMFLWNNETAQKYRRGGKNNFKLIIVANMSEDLDSMGTFFAAMWVSGIVKVSVLLRNETNSRLFTYVPFKNDGICEDTSPVFVGECTSAAEAVFDLSYKVLNLNKCPIRVSLVDDRPWFLKDPFSGRLVNLIHELAHRMNFSIETMAPGDGKKGGVCGREEYIGSRGNVASGKAHMSISSFDQQACSTLEYIGLPLMQCMTWCTPLLSASDYVYYFIIGQFQPKVWAALLLTVFSVSISTVMLCSAAKERLTNTDIFHLAVTLFAQVPAQDFRTSSVRLLVIFWLFTCLVVRTAYEAELKSQSAVPLGSRIIKDLEELLELEMDLCSSLGSLQALQNIEGPTIQKISKKTSVCNGSLFVNLLAAANLKDRAIYTTDLRCSVTFSGTVGMLYPRTGGCTKMIPFSPIVVLRGSPFKIRFQEILHRCFDSGLIYKWIDLPKIQREPGQVRPYSLTHLFPALFVLGIGCTAGFLLLIIENSVRRSLCYKLTCLGRKDKVET